jgi:hypothetical protein
MRNTPMVISLNADGSDPIRGTYGTVVDFLQNMLANGRPANTQIYIPVGARIWKYTAAYLINSIMVAINRAEQPQNGVWNGSEGDPVLDTEL